jgi:hypothetical protein
MGTQINAVIMKTFEDVQKMLIELGDKAFVIGAGTLGEIPAAHKVIVNLVVIDPKEPGITYTTGGDLLSLGNTALRRIATAAGLDWIPELSGRIDDGSNPRKITFIKACSWRDLMGEIHTATGTYELDFDKRENDLVGSKLKSYNYNCNDRARGESFRKQNPDAQVWAAEAARVEILRMMVHGLQRAETGAENRAIIAALGLRRNGYSAADLVAKPFAVFHLVDDIPWDTDPQARTLHYLRASGMARMLAFGGQTRTIRDMLLPRPAPMASLPASTLTSDDDDVADEIGMDPDAPMDPTPVQASAPVAPVVPVVPAAVPAISPAVVPAAPVVPSPASDVAGPAGTPVPQFAPTFEIPTIEKFRTLTRAERESFVQLLLNTRDHKPVSKSITDLTDDELVVWFEGMLSLPLKSGVQV